MFNKLTSQQEALIPVYWEKWRKIALSTERINREKAAEAVKLFYAAIQEQEPEIVVYDSPNAAVINTLRKLSHELGRSCKAREVLGELCINALPLTKICNNLEYEFYRQIGSIVWYQLQLELKTKLQNLVISPNTYSQLRSELDRQIEEQLQLEVEYAISNCIQYELLACDASYYDFCISVLNCQNDEIVWKYFLSLVNECGWIFPGKNTCILCDRPLYLRFDNQNRLHAEGEPAIEYVDGYKLYSYHGVTLPEKYGKLHPQQWRSQWLLKEDNAEVRRVLIQGIGYSRICQELQAIELDSWKEYTLLKIDADVDQEPIYLLKMTCPSTGFIHALRVPPDMTSAHQAICWVNWDIAPEEFAIQT